MRCAGAALRRVDVPDTQAHAGFTKYFGTGSIYCLTPVEEALARRAAEEIERYYSPIPVQIPMPRQLAAPVIAGPELQELDEDLYPVTHDDDDFDGYDALDEAGDREMARGNVE